MARNKKRKKHANTTEVLRQTQKIADPRQNTGGDTIVIIARFFSNGCLVLARQSHMTQL
jgi:hypothetical protein